MSKKVLIIEDSPTQTARLRISLEAKGYGVVVATDGESGLALVARLRPDLIVLDVYLPGMSGFDICKTLKATLDSRNIPVIMFSTENKLKNMVTAYETGADYYVVKSDEGERVLMLLIDTVFTRMSRRMLQVA